jgi:hypothetical protein
MPDGGFADSVAPYDTVPIVAQPAIVTVTLMTNTRTVLLTGDPTRAVLIISSDGAATVFLVGQGSGITDAGIVLSQASPVFQFTRRDHGPLPGLAWSAYTTAAGGAKIAILAVNVQQLSKGSSPLLEALDNGEWARYVGRPARGSRRTKLDTNRWAQSQALSPYDLAKFQ